MFAKPFKVKSNSSLKNTEKKHLVQRIYHEFPSVGEEKVKELVPNKSPSSCMKILLQSGDTVNVYVVDGHPVIIETEQLFIPTICALWKIPDLIPCLTIHAPVLAKMQGGAPLYLPGVVIPTAGAGFPMFARGKLVYCRTTDNAAAGIVGRTLLSSGDMLLKAGGVCLETLHILGDQLCKDPKLSKIERPRVILDDNECGDIIENITSNIDQLSMNVLVKEEWPSLGPKQVPAVVPNETKLIKDIPDNETLSIEDSTIDVTMDNDESRMEEDSIPSDMDGLFQWCLLSFLKLEGKTVELPLKYNLLYKNHLIRLCPPDRTLDVKKSSYKKISKFLEAMQQDGLIEVKEIDKGVDAVVAVNPAHPLVRAHTAGEVREAEPVQDVEYVPPVVREMFCVTAIVGPLFPSLRKGTTITSQEIRSTLTDYVKTKNIQQKGNVVLDTTLAKIVNKSEQEIIKWDELMSSVQNKMTACTEMRYSDGTVKLTKTKLEPIKMQVATRSGNKKVTLVSNLESFGFSLPALSKVCQHGVAASCGVTRTPGARADQLMVQGDQTYFVAKLLIEKYGLPKKYVEGADKALKKKK